MGLLSLTETDAAQVRMYQASVGEADPSFDTAPWQPYSVGPYEGITSKPMTLDMVSRWVADVVRGMPSHAVATLAVRIWEVE